MIYEMAVYCGRLKEWRILNIRSGTIYSGTDSSKEDAEKSIEDGQERAGMTVKRVTLEEVRKLLDKTHNHQLSKDSYTTRVEDLEVGDRFMHMDRVLERISFNGHETLYGLLLALIEGKSDIVAIPLNTLVRQL